MIVDCVLGIVYGVLCLGYDASCIVGCVLVVCLMCTVQFVSCMVNCVPCVVSRSLCMYVVLVVSCVYDSRLLFVCVVG